MANKKFSKGQHCCLNGRLEDCEDIIRDQCDFILSDINQMKEMKDDDAKVKLTIKVRMANGKFYMCCEKIRNFDIYIGKGE